MTSKRNSRVFVDESPLRDVAHSKPSSSSSSSSQQPRRDSRGSVKDDMPQDPADGQRVAAAPRDASAGSRGRSTSRGEREPPAASATRAGDRIAASAPVKASPYPSVPLNGRPTNFGVVVPGVYRSSYPQPEDYAFLQSLQLKTVVTLVQRDEVDHSLNTFTATNGIRQVVFNMKGTKKEAIPPSTMTSILRVVLDHRHYPLLLHCNHGKHRTGCVVAVVRKLSGWSLHSVLDEYRAYAMPKIRECDVDYISRFQSSMLPTLALEPPRCSVGQSRTFFRILLFSAFVVALWLVSGSKMTLPSDHFVA